MATSSPATARSWLAYLSDCSAVPDEIARKIAGVQLLVIDALRHKPHPTHLSVAQALEVAERVQPARTLFTHICHELAASRGGRTAARELGIAYDGLKIEIPVNEASALRVIAALLGSGPLRARRTISRRRPSSIYNRGGARIPPGSPASTRKRAISPTITRSAWNARPKRRSAARNTTRRSPNRSGKFSRNENGGTLRRRRQWPDAVSANQIHFVALIRGMPLKIRATALYPGDQIENNLIG